jgi:hypothetical protein
VTPQSAQRRHLPTSPLDQVRRKFRATLGSRTEPFLSFAEHRIRGAVLDELRRGAARVRGG